MPRSHVVGGSQTDSCAVMWRVTGCPCAGAGEALPVETGEHFSGGGCPGGQEWEPDFAEATVEWGGGTLGSGRLGLHVGSSV